MPDLPRRHIGWYFLLLLVLGGAALGMTFLWWENQRHKQDQADLAKQLRQATEAQQDAIIARRISSQLEEIAYQQKEISDQQRQEAINQTRIADEMREHAELERERALAAQKTALEAYSQMEEQKRLAEHRQEEAEAAQMKADTLALRSLGRSLGSQASTLYTTGNKELASLLSYAAWKFISENQGNVYQPAIFNALSQTSDLSKRWRVHKGAIRDMVLFQEERSYYLLTAGQCGEIFRWKIADNDWIRERVLIDDPNYDFRKVLVDPAHGLYLALSYTDQLVVIDGQLRITVIPLPTQEPVGMVLIQDDLFIASKNGEIQKATVNEWIFTSLYKHPDPITAVEISGHGLIIGDKRGRVYLLDEQGMAHLLWNQIQQPVTSLQVAPQSDIQSIGYKNGVVISGDLKRGLYKELIGHISPVTKIQYMKDRLFTSSYDGTVRLWNLDVENKTVSSIVYEPSEWIHTFVIDTDKERIFTGDEKGNVSSVSISPEYMASEIKKHLIRNFTRDEWNYYIGELVDYEVYK